MTTRSQNRTTPTGAGDAPIQPPMEPVLDNTPDVWLSDFPTPDNQSDRDGRGHALILAAPAMTGSTRLAAACASRIGAGRVSVLCHDARLADLYRTCLPADIGVFDSSLSDMDTPDVILGGCGGIDELHRHGLERSTHGARVFDGLGLHEALSFGHLDESCILTPQAAEFQRVFGEVEGSLELKAITAASRSGAIVVLKGPKTVIAHPDGRCVVNDCPNPWLAKAGTGDVLAGIITGLVAQGMSPFTAAAAGVWVHSRVGDAIGPGLVPPDMEAVIPMTLRDIFHVYY